MFAAASIRQRPVVTDGAAALFIFVTNPAKLVGNDDGEDAGFDSVLSSYVATTFAPRIGSTLKVCRVVESGI
jgi:hypothetical protein